jgi:hypothetical protein
MINMNPPSSTIYSKPMVSNTHSILKIVYPSITSISNSQHDVKLVMRGVLC